MEEFKYKDITNGVINAFFKVYNTLGYGFLEKVYENALFYELTAAGFCVVKQQPIKAYSAHEMLADPSLNNSAKSASSAFH